MGGSALVSLARRVIGASSLPPLHGQTSARLVLFRRIWFTAVTAHEFNSPSIPFHLTALILPLHHRRPQLPPSAPPPVVSFFDPRSRSSSIQVAATWTWVANLPRPNRPSSPPAPAREPRHRRIRTQQDTSLTQYPKLIAQKSSGVALPDKVLRLHCSPSERAQFAAPKREPYDRYRGATSRLQRSRSHDSFEPKQFLRSATVSPLSHYSGTLSSLSLTDSLLTDSTFNIAAMPVSAERYAKASAQWDARKQSLDEFRHRVAANERSIEEHRPRSSARRPSFRRALSIINDVPPTHHPLQSPSGDAPRRKSCSRKRASAPAPPPPETMGPSQYYQDPEARMKLKLLLSSPQDFEEVIEHGFPASPTTPMSPSTPHFSRRRAATGTISASAKASSDVQRFLRNDILSLFDDHDGDFEREVLAAAEEASHDDDTSVGDMDSPITPQDAESIRPLRMHHGISDNPTFFFPESVTSESKSRHSSSRHAPESSFDMPAGAPWPPREMTLRMTLTKPELRAPEEVLYGAHGADPLALDDLPHLEDHAAFKRETKGMKFWRKVKPGQKR